VKVGDQDYPIPVVVAVAAELIQQLELLEVLVLPVSFSSHILPN
tara:strand:+ start:660 stop:791 length:132 start_codon:yes stop_codon:yes gene_type:complete